MIIKVCGMTDAENIDAVAALGVDMIGFIFAPSSPRYVRMISSKAGILPDYGEPSLREEGKSPESSRAGKLKRVGVFVDDMPQNIVTRVYNYHLDYVQLHGSESPVMIENLRRTLVPDIVSTIGIIKAINIAEADDFMRCKQYEGLVDYFLFDTKSKLPGGSGESFDWSLLNHYQGDTPFLLSGGIGPDDAMIVKSVHHPQFAGVDLNSRFETQPGIKDVGKLKTFIKTLRDE